MTPSNYQQAAIGLCRQFKPITDKPGVHGHEFTFSGWRVHLQFAHKSEFGTRFGEWIHIGINDPHHLPPFCDHWKWNIHYSGDVQGVRAELLRELLRRLAKLAEHYNHVPEVTV